MAIEISVIIPTHNRRQALIETLDSINKQSYAKDRFEVIVVNDGCQVTIEDVINEYKNKGLNILILKQTKRGPAAARNLGIKHARGDIIAFTDDDCILALDWLKVMVLAHQANPDVTAIGGETIVKRSCIKTIVSQFLANGAIWAKFGKNKQIIFFPTCNVSLKRKIFDSISFDPQIPYPGGEDLELFWRLYLRGCNFLYLKNAEVMHDRRDSFSDFIYQPYTYGKGNSLVQKKFPQHPALLELSNSSKFLSAVIKLPLFSIHVTKLIAGKYKLSFIEKLLLFFYLVIYRIMYFCGYLREKINL